MVHGTSTNWRARECRSTADAYYAVARSFGGTLLRTRRPGLTVTQAVTLRR
jgi:hypothetical protein